MHHTVPDEQCTFQEGQAVRESQDLGGGHREDRGATPGSRGDTRPCYRYQVVSEVRQGSHSPRDSWCPLWLAGGPAGSQHHVPSMSSCPTSEKQGWGWEGAGLASQTWKQVCKFLEMWRFPKAS